MRGGRGPARASRGAPSIARTTRGPRGRRSARSPERRGLARDTERGGRLLGVRSCRDGLDNPARSGRRDRFSRDPPRRSVSRAVNSSRSRRARRGRPRARSEASGFRRAGPRRRSGRTHAPPRWSVTVLRQGSSDLGGRLHDAGGDMHRDFPCRPIRLGFEAPPPARAERLQGGDAGCLVLVRRAGRSRRSATGSSAGTLCVARANAVADRLADRLGAGIVPGPAPGQVRRGADGPGGAGRAA